MKCRCPRLRLDHRWREAIESADDDSQFRSVWGQQVHKLAASSPRKFKFKSGVGLGDTAGIIEQNVREELKEG
jgi:hypothetical protein